MKKLAMTLMVAGLLALGVTAAPAPNPATSPKTVIHVVTVSWKADAKPEQIKAALDGAHALPASFKGITRVWTKAIKNQTDKANIIVMEFASEKALEDYSGSDAQKEWYKVYTSIRDSSTTMDITN